MMAREKFAARRATTTLNVDHRYRDGETRQLCVSYSRLPKPGDHPANPTGKIGEVWVNSVDGFEKRVNDDMRDACVAISKDLQNGDTLEFLSKSVLRDGRGKPHGFLGSIVDALRKEPVNA